ncbi:MAG: glycosyltransferase family 4 protein [Planctomycetota bacterium]
MDPDAPGRPLRIAHVTLDGNLPRYGIGLAVVSLARALARAGHEVTLLCRPDARARSRPRPGCASCRCRGPRGRSRARGPTRGRCAPRSRPRSTSCTSTGSRGWRGGCAARARRGAPLVLTAHASDELGPSASAAGDAPRARARRHARRVRAVLRRADAVLAPSRFMADAVEAAGAPRVDVVPLGPTDETPAPPAPHEGFVVLALARFVPVKGLRLLLEAFDAAFRDVPAARLVLAGDGPERAALEQEAAARGLAARVRFPGYVEGAARRALLAEADVVAVPTLGAYETFGLSAVDGAAAGAAVVVADGGALPERVAGGTGVVVPSGDVAAWAAALRGLFAAPDRRRRLAAAARAALPDDPWIAVAAAHVSVYRRVGLGRLLPGAGVGPSSGLHT